MFMKKIVGWGIAKKPYKTIPGVPTDIDCLKKCDADTKCNSVGYSTKSKLCSMSKYFKGIVTKGNFVKQPGYIYIERRCKPPLPKSEKHSLYWISREETK